MNRLWPTLRTMLTAHLWFMSFLWLGLLVLTAGIVGGIAIWGTVDRSVWHYMSTQVMRWIVAGLAYDAITTYLRLSIANGRTRKDFLRQLFPYLAVLAVATALMATIGYQVERGVYALADWPQEMMNPTMFGTTGNIAGIIGAFTLMFALWAVVGAMFTAAYNRHALLGLLAIPLAFAIISPGEYVAGTDGVPFLQDVTEALLLPDAASIGFGLLGMVVGSVAIWGIVRDTPVRPRVA
jgi:hypothetical protein